MHRQTEFLKTGGNEMKRPVLLSLVLTFLFSFAIDTLSKEQAMVAREWRGKIPAMKADEYWDYVNEMGIKKILSIDGNLGVQVFRRSEGEITEFVVISFWRSREDIKKFAGENIEKPSHLPRDAEFLIELPSSVKHYDVVMDKSP
jgi:heme-degrading monooxygenase HmoA